MRLRSGGVPQRDDEAPVDWALVLVGGLSSHSHRFWATASAASALIALLAALSGCAQHSDPTAASPLAITPTPVSVKVGLEVQLVATPGGSQVNWQSSAPDVVEVTSGGIALGRSVGVATVTASLTADPSARATVNVAVLANPCSPIPFTIGVTVTRSLSSASCRPATARIQYVSLAFGFSVYDLFEFNVTSATLFKLTYSAAAFPGRFGPFFSPAYWVGAPLWNGQSLSMYVLAPPGTYRMVAGSGDSTAVGAYTITSTVSSGATECLPVVTIQGAMANLVLDPTCTKQRFYTILESLSGSMTATSTSFLPVVESAGIVGGAVTTLSSTLASSGSSATIAWATGFPLPVPFFNVYSRQAGGGGSYSVSFP